MLCRALAGRLGCLLRLLFFDIVSCNSTCCMLVGLKRAGLSSCVEAGHSTREQIHGRSIAPPDPPSDRSRRAHVINLILTPTTLQISISITITAARPNKAPPPHELKTTPIPSHTSSKCSAKSVFTTAPQLQPPHHALQPRRCASPDAPPALPQQRGSSGGTAPLFFSSSSSSPAPAASSRAPQTRRMRCLSA